MRNSNFGVQPKIPIFFFGVKINFLSLENLNFRILEYFYWIQMGVIGSQNVIFNGVESTLKYMNKWMWMSKLKG
jgi:hypothetical protein